ILDVQFFLHISSKSTSSMPFPLSLTSNPSNPLFRIITSTSVASIKKRNRYQVSNPIPASIEFSTNSLTAIEREEIPCPLQRLLAEFAFKRCILPISLQVQDSNLAPPRWAVLKF